MSLSVVRHLHKERPKKTVEKVRYPSISLMGIPMWYSYSEGKKKYYLCDQLNERDKQRLDYSVKRFKHGASYWEFDPKRYVICINDIERELTW